jgi:glutamate/tyrosine decarboxylase-like PLP-dependent enzyme
MNSIINEAWKLARDYFEGSLTLGTGPLKQPMELKKTFDFGLKEKGVGHEQIIDDMKAYLKYTTNTLGPHFQNQLFSGIDPHALAADWLATLTNSTMATFEVAPMATLMEKELVEHMNRKIGRPGGDGIMVTGGSNANLVAMLVARNLKFSDSKTKGLQGRKLVVFVSEEAHYSWDKAANLMGLGSEQLRKVKSDELGRMDASSLRELIRASRESGETPYFIGATAGTTVMGAYDPLLELAKIAKEENLWFHVDGAWGGSVLLSKKHRHLMNGVELADSVTWDTHKMLGTGLISSFLLTKQAGALRRSNHGGGEDYIFHETNHSSWDTGPSSLQCGRRNDAFKVWLMWRALGDGGLEKHVDHLFALAQKSAELIKKNRDLELIWEPQMLNVGFQFKSKTDPNIMVREIRQNVLLEGDFFVNISNRRGKTFFRMITVNPHLTEAHLVKFFNSIIRIGNELGQI